ncbi:MAG TPA: thiamine ABC transporter ATP-binding protein [Aestuariivirgaceae bacterium]|nr:thiamine ABC transporter ATP-binding protein [Aestuariivirgaceae bacterium]
MKAGLELRAVTFRYEDMMMCFDLRVDEEEFIAIMGPSGAGKSTLLQLIAGFEQPLQGEIRWRGKNITRLPPAERPLSIMFQENNLFAHLDAFANVALGLSPSLTLSREQRQETEGALRRVGLEGIGARLPGELSGGERQRVALARTLVRKKPLLLLDEPFAALGPAMKKNMTELMKDLQKERNLTILLVTHEPMDAQAAATHTAFMHEGRILAKRRSVELFKSTDIPELSDYLGTAG